MSLFLSVKCLSTNNISISEVDSANILSEKAIGHTGSLSVLSQVAMLLRAVFLIFPERNCKKKLHSRAALLM